MCLFHGAGTYGDGTKTTVDKTAGILAQSKQCHQSSSSHCEKGGDLEPGTLCCCGCVWCLHLDKPLLEQQIQRNYKGLKRTVDMRSWNKLWAGRYKIKKKNKTKP